MLYDFKTEKWTDWLTQDTQLGFPSWSRDSKYLYFDSSFSNDQSYRRLKIGGAKSEAVVGLKDLRRYNGPLGPWSDLDPGGTPIFVRDTTTGTPWDMNSMILVL